MRALRTPPQAGDRAAMRWRRALLVSGAALWLASFVLPSVRWESLGRFVTDPGYLAARDSLRALLDTLQEPHGETLGWEGYVLMLAWTANLLVPLCCRSRRPLARAAVVLGLLLAWLPLASGLRTNLRVGFFAWALGLTLLGSAGWVAAKDRGNTAAQFSTSGDAGGSVGA
jgi:hypothetical protein